MNTKLIFTVYLLLAVFIGLLLVMSSSGKENSISSKDIDKMIEQKWSGNNLEPSEQTTDAEFVRRIYLDLTGRTPTAGEVAAFLSDASSVKRQKKIDELLGSEEYGNFMADEWINILFPYDTKKKVPQVTYKLVKNEFANSFNQNRPYTEFVNKIVSAQGFATSNPYTLFAASLETPEDAAGRTMKIFAGKQIQCAQCHKHPYENITQDDFYGVAAFFSRKQVLPLLNKKQADNIEQRITKMEKQITKARDNDKNEQMNTKSTDEMPDDMKKMPEHQNVKKNNPDKSANKNKQKKYNIPPQWAVDSLKQRLALKEFTPDVLIWDAYNGQMTYDAKGTQKTVAPKYLGGASVSSDPGIDRRQMFADYLTTKDTRQVAKEFVNRFWKHFLGYGFINPVDDFKSDDSGTNPQLLDMLADEFIKSNFDIKNLFRLITNTDVYQLSSTPNTTNKDDHDYFSRAILRPLSSIQLANSLMTTSGYFNMKSVIDKEQSEIDKIKFRIRQLFVYTFNDDEMNESENFNGTITQALLLMNSNLSEKVTEKKPGNTLANIMNNIKEPQDRINYLYLNTLSRYPTKKEMSQALDNADEKKEFYEDLQWSLINSSEYIFNH